MNKDQMSKIFNEGKEELVVTSKMFSDFIAKYAKFGISLTKEQINYFRDRINKEWPKSKLGKKIGE